MHIRNAFFAYPGDPPILGTTIETACADFRTRTGGSGIRTWRDMDVCGAFIASQVLAEIESHDVLIADITRLNFNVLFEIGYAVGKSKVVYIVKCNAVRVEDISLSDFGIFDTLGYQTYSNSQDLTKLLVQEQHELSPIELPVGKNSRQPLYIVQPKFKTDFVVRLLSRLNKTKLAHRSFDPNEQVRLAAFDAIQNVSESFGILIPLLSTEVQDARIHNLRASFVAGLAMGMGRNCYIVQQDNSPVPIDYRDLVHTCYAPAEIDKVVSDFAADVAENLTSTIERPNKRPDNLLQRISLGASTSENELKDLATYYLETDPYLRVTRGEARIVVGRKGSGKTAMFYRARDRARRDKSNVVLDLKPEGYQLKKFKDTILRLLAQGTQEHLVTAFWEYVLYLEICAKLISDDSERHIRDAELYELYNELVNNYGEDEYITEADFSDRLEKLADSIIKRYAAEFSSDENKTLSHKEITGLLYHHDLTKIRSLLKRYLAHKGALWILFDNIDKGWSSWGVEPGDLVILRTLLDATRKIEKEFSRNENEAHTIIFLRNDVYDLLLEDMSDRGKETKVTTDWTDEDLLREIIRLRLISSDGWGVGSDDISNEEFSIIWRQIAAAFINGEESFQYLLERCLMRPRALIDLIANCRSFAVNLRHEKIEETDFAKGLSEFSNDLVTEINLEIRDVMPEVDDLLYHFIGKEKTISFDSLQSLLLNEGRKSEDLDRILDVLVWHGVLGLIWPDGRVEYIYHVKYNLKLFKAQMARLKNSGLVFQINPAFWPALL